MYSLSNILRNEGDPKVVRSGPSSLGRNDRMARNLGWLSIGLGVFELVAAGGIARALGMRGRETLVRAYGMREILSGILCLSVDKQSGMWSRVAGDGIDAATLIAELRSDNPRKANVLLALLMVGGIARLDYKAAEATARVHREGISNKARYRDRSGFPKGIAAIRAAANKPLVH
jgi:hypothetical protein